VTPVRPEGEPVGGGHYGTQYPNDDEPEVTVTDALTSGGDNHTVRLTAWVRGRVQGVGFRWWVRSQALTEGLTGWAANLADGRVEVVAEGRRTSCQTLLETLSSGRNPGVVTGVTSRWSPARGGLTGFHER
jgi:acylphosphatase